MCLKPHSPECQSWGMNQLCLARKPSQHVPPRAPSLARETDPKQGAPQARSRSRMRRKESLEARALICLPLSSSKDFKVADPAPDPAMLQVYGRPRPHTFP